MSHQAQFHGRCNECEQPIIPGQQIHTVDDEWLHVSCGSLAVKVICTCETCMAVHAGVMT
jgi:hypothetical protein